MPNTLFGFDYGTKRIGIAVGQTITGTASPLGTLLVRHREPDWARLDALIAEWHPDCFVVGLPLNVDGTKQPITGLAEQFAKKLKQRYARPTHMVDERYTTKEARQQMFEQGGFRTLENTNIDAMAATLILEDWLQQLQ